MVEAAQSDRPSTPTINAWFVRNASLAELVKDVKPLVSTEDLALDDLTSEEANSFPRAIEE